MNREITVPPIRFYILLSFLLHILFLVTAVVLMASFAALNEGIFFVSVIFFIFSPVVGIVGWLIDKGSGGENRSITLKVIGGVPGMFYGAIAGAMIFRELFGSAVGVGIIGFISFFLLGQIVGSRVGPPLAKRLAGFMGIRPSGDKSTRLQ